MRAVLARALSPPAGRRRFFSHVGRKIEVTLGKKPARHASFSYPRDRRRFSLRSTEKPTDDESGSREQRQISRFSLFFSLFFFLPRLIPPEIGRR
ncbi:hypothetical protein BHM03_00052869 [Ensete ventricosum]|nr:hypothetical protein BHM03_00052869 [Ensete ventricosum]